MDQTGLDHELLRKGKKIVVEEDALQEIKEREESLNAREEALKQREDALVQLQHREEALKQREDGLEKLQLREEALRQREEELRQRERAAAEASGQNEKNSEKYFSQKLPDVAPSAHVDSVGLHSDHGRLRDERATTDGGDAGEYKFVSDRPSIGGELDELRESTFPSSFELTDDSEAETSKEVDSEKPEESWAEEPAQPLSVAQQRWKKAYLSIKKHLAITKHGLRTAIGTGAEIEGFSLGFLPVMHPVRRKLFAFLYHQQTEYCLALLICMHLAILVLKAQTKDFGMKPTSFLLDIADATVTLIYTIEIILRIVCLGFVGGRKTFLQNNYNRLDFVIVCDSWIHILNKLRTRKDTFVRIAVFRALRVLPILRSFSFFGNLLAILEASKQSIGPLNNVILLSFLILSFYGLVGVQTLGGSLRRRCVTFSEPGVIFQEQFPPRSCGIEKGYRCPDQQGCEYLDNPNWGIMNFDSFPFAILTMFQVITFSGWSSIMYSVEDAEYRASEAYFITLCVFGSYFLVSVFVAGISGVFLRVRREHQILIRRYRQVTQSSSNSSAVMANVFKEMGHEVSDRSSWQEKLHKRSIYAVKIARRHTVQFLNFIVGRQNSSFDEEFRVLGPFSAAYKLSDQAKAIVKGRGFQFGVQIMISINVCILCLHHEGMSNQFHNILLAIDAGEGIMLLTFILEMGLRFLACGFKEFVNDGMNIFDMVIILISCGSLITRMYPNISATRALRWFYSPGKKGVANRSIMVGILTVLYMLAEWDQSDCIRSLGALSSLLFFYFLIIFIYAIVSMELWGGQFYHFPDGYPRQNYDSISQAMLSWFIVTTGESWAFTMGNAVRPGVQNKWTSPILFVFYFGFTVYMILNLIISIILEKSELTDSQKKQIQKMEHLKFLRKKLAQSSYSNRRGSWIVDAISGAHHGMQGLAKKISTTMRVSHIYIPGRLSRIAFKRQLQDSEVQLQRNTGTELPGAASMASASQNIIHSQPHLHGQHHGNLRRRSTQRGYQLLHQTGFRDSLGEGSAKPTALESSVLALMDEQNQPEPDGPSKTSSTRSGFAGSGGTKPRSSFLLADFEGIEHTTAQRKAPWYISDSAFFIFKSDSWLRIIVQRLVENRWYKRFVIFMVFVSIIAVAETNSMGRPVVAPFFIDTANKVVLVVFGLDLILKSISYGFLFTPDAYLGDPYNFLDIFNFIVDLLSNLSWSPYWQRVFRMLLSCRPMRFISRFSGLRNLLTSLLFTVPAIASTLAFSLTIFAIFATIGVQLFRGRFNACNDDTVKNHLECVGVFENASGILAPRIWETPTFHFDNFGNAMLSLYVLSTFDNWISYFLNTAMDIPAHPEDQPSRNHSPFNAIYFVAFVFIGGHFIVRMFVGVFVDQFGIISGSKLLTERQKLWRDNNRIIQQLAPTRLPTKPRGSLRSVCFSIGHSVGFGRLIVILVIANFVCLTSQVFHENITHHVEAVDNIYIKLDAAFLFIFAMELAIKLLGSKFNDWCVNKWNFYEAFIVVGSAFCIFPGRGTGRLKVGRVFFLVRIFRIIRYIPSLQTLVQTVFVSLPSMVHIISLLLIVLFEFAGVGVQLFSHVRDGACIGPHMNFKTFINAFVVMFQVATADNWSCIMNDARVQYPSCAKSNDLTQDDCGFRVGGLVYFIFLVSCTTWICSNLFVAEILDTITFGLLNEEAMITPSHLLDFQRLWADQEFDPKRKGFIGLHKLRSFLDSLGTPLGRRRNAPAKWYTRIEYEVMSFHQKGKGVPFKQLLETLTLYKIGSQGLELALRIEREKRIQQVYRHGAGTKIQALVRGFLVRTRLKKLKAGQSEIEAAAIDASQRLDPDSLFSFNVKNMLDRHLQIYMLKTLWF